MDIHDLAVKHTMRNERPYVFPMYPRVRLGTLDILPKMDRNDDVMRDVWVLPGCRVLTTSQVQQLARRLGLYFEVIEAKE